MPTTLITGSSVRAVEVAAALQEGDWQPPLRADTVQALDDVCARVALVGDEQSPSEIASIARWRGNRTPPMDWYVDFEPALGSADWRCELLSLLEPT